MTAARGTLKSAFQIDQSLIRPVVGAVTALPVVVAFVIGLTIGSPRTAIAMAFGANLIAIVSLVGAPRLPLRLAVIDAAAMGLSVFVGSATGPYPWLHAALLVPWCFATGMLVVFGQTQATVGTQAIIAFLVIGRFSQAPLPSAHTGLLVIAGSLIEILALVVLRLPPSLHFQRTQLADGFDALSALALRDPYRPTVDVASTLEEAERALSSPSLFGRTDVRELRAALDQARRIRLDLSTLAGLRARLASEGSFAAEAAVESCLEDAATALAAIAADLRHPAGEPGWHRAAAAYRERVDRLERDLGPSGAGSDLGAAHCVASLAAIGGQVRAAGNLVDAAGSEGGRELWRPGISMAGARRPGRWRHNVDVVLENCHWDAPAFRHAVRLAIAVPASALLATALSLPRGFWVPYAVAVILKPDYSTLFGRGIGRVLGTVLGATLAAALISGLHPDLAMTAVLIGLTAWVAYSTYVASFSVGVGFVTALVLILLSTSMPNPVSTSADRFIDIILGGLIAAAAYRLWPTSPRAEVRDAESGLFHTLGDYLEAVFAVVEGGPVRRAALASRSRANRRAWAKAEAAVGRSIQEPSSTRIDVSRARGLLAGALRIVRVSHALRIDAEHGATVTGFPEFERLHDGLLRALDALSAHLDRRPAGSVPDLRGLFREMTRSSEAEHVPRSVLLHLDELVNATNTAMYLTDLAESPHTPGPWSSDAPGHRE